MTESEAKTKWCPKANRSNDNENCIASNCAMWVWTKTRDHSRGPNCTMPKEEWQGRCGLIHVEGVY